MGISRAAGKMGVMAGLMLAAAPAMARDYCPDRPGLGTPACTMETGRLSVEASGIDWTHDRTDTSVEDEVLAGDLALRYGIADHAELRLGWTPYGWARSRDRATGAVERQGGTGDVTLGLRRNLMRPDGEGFSVAVQPQISLPTGGQAIGAGDWGASLLVPVSLPIAGPVSLELAPEVDAAVDEDRHGRHLAYGVAGGLEIEASDKLNFALEGQVMRDRDPAGHITEAAMSLAAALKLSENCQIDAGGVVALNHDTPDSRVYVGISRRF